MTTDVIEAEWMGPLERQRIEKEMSDVQMTALAVMKELEMLRSEVTPLPQKKNLDDLIGCLGDMLKDSSSKRNG